MSNNLAIILARKDSKRIKNKNIINFFNKPIIYWSIKEGRKTGLFNRIIVSTDSKKIKKISEYYGAKVPFLRSKKNSSDNATSAEAVLETLNKIKLSKKNIYCCIMYASSPFIRSKDIKYGLNQIKKKKLSTFFQVTKVETPKHKFISIKNKTAYFNSKKFQGRSQDSMQYYRDAGQWYWINISDFLKQKKIIMRKNNCKILSNFKTHDINDIEDLKVAKLKFKNYR